MKIDPPDDFGERNHPDPSENIDPDEFHSLFEWGSGENAKQNLGYCSKTGMAFSHHEPGDNCPLCNDGTLTTLPDIE